MDPLTASSAATILTSPAVTAVTNPDLPTFATPADEELQLTLDVTFFVLPSLYFAVAVSCSLCPAVIDPFAAVTVIDLNDGELGELIGENATLPQPASKNSPINDMYSERRVCICENGS